MKPWLVVGMAAGAWLACTVAAGDQAGGPVVSDEPVVSAQQIDLLRKDIRSQKKQLIAQNLHLTDQDATKFWPIYDRYTADLVKINDKKYSVIQQYANQFGKMSDDKAMSLMGQWTEVDIEAAKLRAKYLPIVAGAIGGTKAATFAQLDRRIAMMVELQLSSKLPLAQSQ